ncbi:MAG: hypothetical protein NZ853_04745 [Leptospiraceae bacterium]|nr:hypothetical protein [Leptospiraceae bacterium]MDW7975920.1 hypothetical protein [Leptospiraceae bacterium]
MLRLVFLKILFLFVLFGTFNCKEKPEQNQNHQNNPDHVVNIGIVGLKDLNFEYPIYVYEKPNLSSKVIFRISEEEWVKVYDPYTLSEWKKIEIQNQIGYVQQEFVSFLPEFAKIENKIPNLSNLTFGIDIGLCDGTPHAGYDIYWKFKDKDQFVNYMADYDSEIDYHLSHMVADEEGRLISLVETYQYGTYEIKDNQILLHIKKEKTIEQHHDCSEWDKKNPEICIKPSKPKIIENTKDINRTIRAFPVGCYVNEKRESYGFWIPMFNEVYILRKEKF